MTTSIGHRRSSKRLLAAAVAITSIAGATLAASSSASAAAGDVTDASLNWGIRESLRNYVGNQTAALPTEGGPAPVGTRIVPSGGATFDPASTPIPAQTSAEERLPYIFSGDGGNFEDESNFVVDFAGEVQLWFPSHNFDIRLQDLSIQVDDGVAGVYGDVSFTDVSWDGANWNLAATTLGDDIQLATVAAVDVDYDEATGTLSVAGSQVAFTAEHAAVYYAPLFGSSLYNAGDPMDDFTLTATIEQAGTPAPTFDPEVSPSKNWVHTSGDTITVDISGFDPTLLGNGAPRSNQPAGYYVVIGSFADDWSLAGGAAGSTRPNLVQSWAIPLRLDGTLTGPEQQPPYFLLDANGAGSVTISVPAFDPAALANGTANFGIYTYAASTRIGSGTSWTLTPDDWAERAKYETFTPLTIVHAQTQTIVAEVPQPEPSGEFSWTIEENAPVALSAFAAAGDNLVAAGDINPVRVTDTRVLQENAWSITGSVGNFTSGANSIPADSLTWTPAVIEEGAGAVAGSGPVSLGSGSTLAGAATDHAPGSALLGADLTLTVPNTTPAGTYTATLTLTALS